jgi:hypothetical protein
MEPELSYLGMGWMIIFATDGSGREKKSEKGNAK